MSALGTFSAQGFHVTASNAIDLLAGTQSAGAGMVAANVREMAQTLHVDLAGVGRAITAQGNQLAAINTRGFDAVRQTLEGGFGTLETLSGVSIATQAVGFAVVATQLAGVRKDLRALAGQAAELVALQQRANVHLESLVDFAQRQLKTQEQILATLVNSRTVEAQQLIRQGWENLRSGYEDDAFERFVRSLEFDNTVYVTHAELATLYEKRGQHDKAEDHFRRASRFAVHAGPPVAAFAAVQLATFLDRRGRAAEALPILRQGLAAWRTPAWVFYLAEVTARHGDEADALACVREAIAGDVALFVAAMASERLQWLQPRLARLLLDLDLAARSPVFDAVRRTAVAVRQLEALGADAEALRARAAQLFERGAVAPFAALAPLREEGARVASEAAARVDRVAQDLAAPVAAALDAYAAHVAQPPSVTAPGAPTAALTRASAVGLVAAGLAASCLAGTVAALTASTSPWEPGDGVEAPPVASGDAATQSGVLCAAVVLLVFLVPALVLYLRADRQQRTEGDERQRTAAATWWAWHDRTRALASAFQCKRDDLQQRLAAAVAYGSGGALDEGRRWVAGVTLPAAPAPPAWVQIPPSGG